MSFEEIIIMVETAAIAIFGGHFIRGTLLRGRKKKEEAEAETRTDERAKARERESRLALKLADANIQLSIVNAQAIKDGRVNGELESAKRYAEEARREYREFVDEVFTVAMEG